LIYLAAQTVVVALVFCFVAGLFDRWDGALVGVLPPAGTAPKIYQVVIVEDDSQRIEKMPADVVNGLELPVLQFGIVPAELPPDPALTKKSRFQFSYMVLRPGEEGKTWQSYDTTTIQAVGVALVIWFIGVFMRNMAYAGSPIALERQDAFLPKGLVQAGVVAQASERGRKQPPPGRPRRGPRR
jgi:hypothetical protein